MKKLELNVDDLRVESFETERHDPPRGTVIGAGCSEDRLTILEPEPGTNNMYCISVHPCIATNVQTGGCFTCLATCNGTCGDSCPGEYCDLY